MQFETIPLLINFAILVWVNDFFELAIIQHSNHLLLDRPSDPDQKLVINQMKIPINILTSTWEQKITV